MGSNQVLSCDETWAAAIPPSMTTGCNCSVEASSCSQHHRGFSGATAPQLPKKEEKLHPWISRTAALVAASCLCFSFTLEKSAASYHELRFGFLRFSWRLSSSKAARRGLSLRLQFSPEYASVWHWTFPQNGIKVYNVVGLRPYLNLVAFLALVELWLDRKPDLCSKYYFFSLSPKLVWLSPLQF